MLVEFKVSNYRSFAAEKRLSMVAGPGLELASNTVRPRSSKEPTLLRTAVVYGPNASGKSNLINAFEFFLNFLITSTDSRKEGTPIAVEPFRLDSRLAQEPSTFEVTFLRNGILHRYGFVVSQDRVHEEWLYVYTTGKPRPWFRRTETTSETGKVWYEQLPYLRGEKKPLAQRTRSDSLFLSVAAQWNHPQLAPIYHWLKHKLRVIVPSVKIYGVTETLMLTDGTFREWLTSALNATDLAIQEVTARETQYQDLKIRDTYNMPDEMVDYLVSQLREYKEIRPGTIRLIRDTNGPLQWDLTNESEGTQHLFHWLGPLYVVLRQGGILMVDELDNSLHPYVTRALVDLFHNPTTNPYNAQLIFTTHNTSLLDQNFLRRDQIWLTSADHTGETDLYSLQDFAAKKNENFQKEYLSGRYGAVPFLEPFKSPVASPLINQKTVA